MVGDASVVAGRLRGDPVAVDRLAGDGEPQFPLSWGLRLVIGVEQEVSADRTSAVLCFQEAQPACVQWWRGLLAPPVGPVSGQGGVVRGRPSGDQRVADDRRPGVADLVGAAVAVTEHPPVLPGLVN